MSTYIALLRGINVSGHNIIKMAALKELLLNEGLVNVTTYIQSGNVIFQSNLKSNIALEDKIKAAIATTYGYSVEVLVLSRKELETIFAANPFLGKPNIEIKSLAVMVLKSIPKPTELEVVKQFVDTLDESVALLGNGLYLHYPNGIGRSKLSHTILEKKLKVSGTSRNWKTMTKLMELSSVLS